MTEIEWMVLGGLGMLIIGMIVLGYVRVSSEFASVPESTSELPVNETLFRYGLALVSETVAHVANVRDGSAGLYRDGALLASFETFGDLESVPGSKGTIVHSDTPVSLATNVNGELGPLLSWRGTRFASAGLESGRAYVLTTKPNTTVTVQHDGVSSVTVVPGRFVLHEIDVPRHSQADFGRAVVDFPLRITTDLPVCAYRDAPMVGSSPGPWYGVFSTSVTVSATGDETARGVVWIGGPSSFEVGAGKAIVRRSSSSTAYRSCKVVADAGSVCVASEDAPFVTKAEMMRVFVVPRGDQYGLRYRVSFVGYTENASITRYEPGGSEMETFAVTGSDPTFATFPVCSPGDFFVASHPQHAVFGRDGKNAVLLGGTRPR